MNTQGTFGFSLAGKHILENYAIICFLIYLGMDFLKLANSCSRKIHSRQQSLAFYRKCFTSALCCEFLFTPDSRNFSNFTWHHTEMDKFLLKIMINGENRNSWTSCFMQMMKSEITFTLDSRKFWIWLIGWKNFWGTVCRFPFSCMVWHNIWQKLLFHI